MKFLENGSRPQPPTSRALLPKCLELQLEAKMTCNLRHSTRVECVECLDVQVEAFYEYLETCKLRHSTHVLATLYEYLDIVHISRVCMCIYMCMCYSLRFYVILESKAITLVRDIRIEDIGICVIAFDSNITHDKTLIPIPICIHCTRLTHFLSWVLNPSLIS